MERSIRSYYISSKCMKLFTIFKRLIKGQMTVFVVEYKTRGEMFTKKFAYTYYEYKMDDPKNPYHFFVNDFTGQEKSVYLKHLEELETRPITNEEIDPNEN